MARQGRILHWAVCAIVIGGLAFARAASGREATAVVEATAMADGSVQLEGVRYVEPDAIKKKLANIAERKPLPDVQITTQKGASMQARGPALVLLQKAGLRKSGFITHPTN